MPVRVIVADDQPLVRTGIGLLLGAAPDIQVVGQADDGVQAVDLARRHRPDVVVLDLHLPPMGGIEAARTMAGTDAGERGRPVNILFLTASYTTVEIYEGVCAGAVGFLLKGTAPHVLLSAVRAIAGGGAWLDSDITRAVLRDFATTPAVSRDVAPRLGLLTAREQEILALVAQGLSNVEIAGQLFIRECTVKTHFTRVLSKLGARDRAQAVVAAYQAGLVCIPVLANGSSDGPWSPGRPAGLGVALAGTIR